MKPLVSEPPHKHSRKERPRSQDPHLNSSSRAKGSVECQVLLFRSTLVEEPERHQPVLQKEAAAGNAVRRANPSKHRIKKKELINPF